MRNRPPRSAPISRSKAIDPARLPAACCRSATFANAGKVLPRPPGHGALHARSWAGSKGIRQRLHEILTLRRPEALFALDHITALIAYQTMTDLGLSAPGDLAFACFDEAEWMRLVRPAITTVRQPIEEMATAAWQQLSRRMGGNADPVKTLRLACSVEVRGSTLREGGQSSTAA